ncbi:restriction endonuclease [Schaalia canis]|uniref:Restriction endonuclease n=2 Tax=Schaalia canis TaxID=100469 RepID=A0A3P1SFG9_9ACTO|nr:restriction endonuclease [Schaalia canis]
MLASAMNKKSGLLGGGGFLGRAALIDLARLEPEPVRQMFLILFDESEDFFVRVEGFKQSANRLLNENSSRKLNSHQDERAITAYLALRYPDRYGYYKFEEFEYLSELFDTTPRVVSGAYRNNLVVYREAYAEISSAMREHPVLSQLVEQYRTEDHYADSKCMILAQDFLSHLYAPIKRARAAERRNKRVSEEESKHTRQRSGILELASQDLELVHSDKNPAHPASSPSLPQPVNYLWMNCNPKIWSLQSMALGAQQSYTLYNDNGNRRQIFANFEKVQPGDVVIGYESTPVKKIVALLRISKASDGQRIVFEKVEGLTTPIPLADVKDYMVAHQVEGAPNMQGSLFNLGKDHYDYLLDMIRKLNPAPASSETLPTYTRADFLAEVFMAERDYDRLARRLKQQKNLILQGSPGVGKTFAARRLAFSLMGVKDEDRVQFVQFHQSYSYEDFVMGYKPTADGGFELKEGIFYRFCRSAANQPDLDFYFIIDEINRAPLSKVFGELLSAIEADYRGIPVTLQYNGLPFDVPENLHIIGMMNTADRSLAIIDYALRRRFGFHAMHPGFDNAQFQAHIRTLNPVPAVHQVISQVRALNSVISQDATLGPGFQIGHSYFCSGRTVTTLDQDTVSDIVECDLIPLLEEYWFDEPDSVKTWAQRLRDAAAVK